MSPSDAAARIAKKLKSSLLVQNFVLFAVYFATARIGLELTAVNKFAALMWPPTGIALGAVLIFGFQLWPGVFF